MSATKADYVRSQLQTPLATRAEEVAELILELVYDLKIEDDYPRDVREITGRLIRACAECDRMLGGLQDLVDPGGIVQIYDLRKELARLRASLQRAGGEGT